MVIFCSCVRIFFLSLESHMEAINNSQESDRAFIFFPLFSKLHKLLIGENWHMEKGRE